MAGKNRTSWISSSRAIIPAAIVIGEATWVSLLVNALVNTGHGPHVYLPFAAFAIPGVVAVVVGDWSMRRSWRWSLRLSVLVVIGVVGAALSAGLIAQLGRPAPFWRVAIEPWSVYGHVAAVTAAGSWFVAVLAWARGGWLGASPPAFRHAARSMGFAGLAFIGVFAGRADSHAAAFRSATDPAGWLLFAWFILAAAGIALVRQRELEEEILVNARSHPTTAWLAVLVVPLLAVALLALLVAVVLGPAAPVVERAIGRGAEVIWRAIAFVFLALWHLFPKSRTTPRPVHLGRGTAASPPPAQLSHRGLHVPPIVGQILAVVAVAVPVILILRYLRPIGRLRHTRPPDRTEDEERDSVFSWRHLLEQIAGALRRLFARRRHSGADGSDLAAGAFDDLGDARTESVRHAYRRMLVAARVSGFARRSSETPRELEGRLCEGPAAAVAEDLSRLTGLYDAVRYGELDVDEQARLRAIAHADVVTCLLEQPEDGQPTELVH